MYAVTEAFPYECGNHRRTGTFGNGAAPTLLPEKNYTMPESAIVVQSHSNRIETKASTILTSNGTVIIELRILDDLDRQPSKVRTL